MLAILTNFNCPKYPCHFIFFLEMLNITRELNMKHKSLVCLRFFSFYVNLLVYDFYLTPSLQQGTWEGVDLSRQRKKCILLRRKHLTTN